MFIAIKSIRMSALVVRSNGNISDLGAFHFNWHVYTKYNKIEENNKTKTRIENRVMENSGKKGKIERLKAKHNW